MQLSLFTVWKGELFEIANKREDGSKNIFVTDVLDMKEQCVRVKSYSQRLKMLFKMSLRLDIERACD